MRGVLVIAGSCAVVLSIGCGGSISPAGPSAVASVPVVLRGADTAASRAVNGSAVVVPFKGTLDGQYGTPSGQFPIINESIAATGQATQLGRYTLQIAETVNLLQATATGTFTFIAADGATLQGTFMGHAQPGALVTIIEEATILGGTGRFAGATGSFTIDRVFDPVNRTTTGTFEGTTSAREQN